MHVRTRPSRKARLSMAVLVACASAALAASGCAHRDQRIAQAVSQGEFGRARQVLLDSMTQRRSSRSYMYDRLMLGMLGLVDGLARPAERVVNEVYDVLRTQGINADKTVASIVINEGVKFWKGEPFEQAMAFVYVALQKAMLNQWDNARAAAASSLFRLRDFGLNEKGVRKTTLDIAQTAAVVEKKQKQDYLSVGYEPVETNFALGYLIKGIANVALSRQQEALADFVRAEAIRPALRDITARLRERRFNTVLVVDYGFGPAKVAYGPDNALARFVPRRGWESDERMLVVRVNGMPAGRFPYACDLNRMAADHMWNNLEDVRLAKAYIGTALMGAGSVAVFQRNRGAQIAGLAMLAVGAMMKAMAHADTRHCVIMPQRVYVAPLNVSRPNSVLTLEVDQDPASRFSLPGVGPPEAREPIRLYYVRLPPRNEPLAWASQPKLRYANDQVSQHVPGDELPYILGGRCVRRPSAAVLKHYQEAGFLLDMTVADLEELYRAEGIALGDADDQADAGPHVLEGGTSLASPPPGTVGFVRLFCREHPPYRPRSELVRKLAERIRQEREAVLAGTQQP